MIETIAASGTLEQAYAWYIGTRQDAHHNHEVWHLRRNWAQIRPRIQAQLRAGTYQFAPCRSCQVDGTWQSVWSAPDAVVQKAMALVLTERLSPHLSRDCYHLAGRGGQKGCVMRIKHAIRRYRYVCRSDVDSYYATINHQVLLAQIRERIPDPAICTLIARLLDRLDDVNAELHRVTVGITKGSPLSPLLGAIYLDAMDRAIGDYCRPRGLRYYRYMDDWLILCHTRHQLRAIVRLMNTQLNRVQQTKHPFKTYIGQLRTTGIDFLGYCIGAAAEGLSVAAKTWTNHLAKCAQLYEQQASPEAVAAYVRRWQIWLRSGVDIDLSIVLARLSNTLAGTAQLHSYDHNRLRALRLCQRSGN